MKDNSKLWNRVIAFLMMVTLCSCSHLVDSKKDGEKAKVLLQAAVDQFNSRNYSKSIETTMRALKYEPEMEEGYNHLAIVYMETKRYKKSYDAFEKALKIRPQYPEVFNNMGVLYNRQERFTAAIKYFKKALQDPAYRTPENAYTNMGYAYYRLGKLTTAKAHHQKALDVLPNFCLASKNMADVYVKEKRYKRASRYYRKAVNNCPLYQESRYKLGLVLAKMGKRKMARAELEKLIKQHREGPYVERSNEVLKYLR